MRCLPILLATTALATAAPDPSPAPEIVAVDKPVELPPVPAFDLPPVVDGVHAARELRVAGKPLLDKDVKVSGYILSIYDCATAADKPCHRPRFYLGDAKDTPVANGVWVVDPPVAPGKVGDFVVVTGKFAQVSAKGERNLDGLVIAASIAKASPSAPLTAVVEEKPVAPPVALKPRPKHAIGAKQQNESADHLSAGNKLGASGKLDEAIAEYEQATAIWPGNHLAWYGLGGIHAARGAWDKAAKAFDEAVSIRPDVALYLMWRGVVGYELESDRGDAASYDQAADYLRRAIAAAPKMWRAHYYLGKIERARGHAHRAAEEFTAAIANNPREPGPYGALAELYRRWDDVDQAVAVATAGTANVPGAADLWYVLGLALERKSAALAIDAFGKAIATGKASPLATYERGRMELETKDYANARKDLEAYVKSGDRSAFQLELAKQLLGQLPAKR